MPTPTFQPPQGQQSTAQLQDWIVKLVRDLNYLLENLDTVNINRLNASVIIAQTITALQIAANTITADKMNVSQLSAIAADLGTITAGIIYGAYIATANGTYPRIEFSSTGNLLGAFLDATHSLKIVPNVGGAPGVGFYDPSGLTGYLYGNSGIGLLAAINDVELTSLSGNIAISSAAGTISDLVASINSLNSSITTLTAAISGKVNSGSSTSTAPTHDHGIPSGTLLAISGGGSVAWVPSGSHSHTV